LASERVIDGRVRLVRGVGVEVVQEQEEPGVGDLPKPGNARAIRWGPA
jgi:hypothetical protein